MGALRRGLSEELQRVSAPPQGGSVRRHGADGGAEDEGRQRGAAEGECSTPGVSVRSYRG